MKKRFLHIVAFFALAAGLSLTSCTKEDPAEAVNISALETGTITGIAHATLDATLPVTTLQFAPQGTVIFLTIQNSALGAGNGVYRVSTTVGTNGTFTFSNVPTKNAGVTATITGDAFKAVYRMSPTQTQTRVFEGASGSAFVVPGGNAFETISYFSSKFE